ncbi:probable LRR receptor-like serine/threonine-protein kinase At3g47570 [Chenopodium quinoa]|uniref:non-specific serine/threonine protein kinase n=1 Tax=Chenopodium quinoa TaxID=63459 RepID=A0A803LDW0_CHEQI|nr:probable LRR receptor-like serine/threonine-protein kinase At3g47570 [Chenopodium quinoa]
MSFSTFYLIILATAFMYCLHFSVAGTNETDRLALLDFKAKITGDPLGVMSSWNDTTHFCEWHGITCHRGRRVKKLKLYSSKLTGFLSPSIGNLSFLKVLQLYNNTLGGTIPPEIGRLHRLRDLQLGNNTIEGHIPPNISACSRLLALDIRNNRLVGKIPSKISYLVHLQYINLHNNNLTGTIPSSFGNFSSLYLIDLESNNLSGSIPESLGKLNKLTYLALGENMLSGIVPSSIFNLTLLVSFGLGFNNNLEGSLPSDLGIKLPNLQWFSISSNNFTGSIPTSISNSSGLTVLQLDDNNLTGQVPSLHKLANLSILFLSNNSLGHGQAGDLNFAYSLANATDLQVLGIGDNILSGNFPKIFCNFSMLSSLEIDDNYIDGQIPACIENLEYLTGFAASGNQLSGIIPQGIGKLRNLDRLMLDANQFSGKIPSSIGNLTKMTILNLYHNNLVGQIPSTLGSCKNLLGMDLSFNRLSGRIPSQLFDISTLSIGLYLSFNKLSGSLPEEVGQLKNLGLLRVTGNTLSGEIPSTLSSCVELTNLYMDGNFLQGAIPDALSELKGLNELDLSKNNLSGKIPQFLESLPLQMLNLSYNSKLEGEVPTGGIFSNATGLSLDGIRGLCGGRPELKLPKCNKKNQKKSLGHKNRFILGIVFGLLGIISMVTIFVSLYIYWYKKKTKLPTPLGNFSENYPNLSYQTLLKATNGFSFDNLIGRGTFGAVYKGILHDLVETSIIAIKIFNLEQHGASKSFMAECGVLRTIRHRNLIKVITACSSVDYQGNDFKALVYEYMVRGSLEEWLHPVAIDVVEDTDTAPRLSLRQRLDIVVDVASALEYLHHNCGAPIIHCDLKPSNVLLDEELVAHVSDFGLAKFLSESISSSIANQSSSLGVRGTVGYAPPEYGLGNEASTNGDVYSFGILLLEMITGKRPTNDMFSEGISLHDYVKEALPERVIEIVDHSLVEDIDSEEIDSRLMLEALTSVLGIALSCSTEVPQERLDMSDVTAKLSSIRKKLLGTRLDQRRIRAGTRW